MNADELRLQRLHTVAAWVRLDRRNVQALADELGYTDYLPVDRAHAVAVLLQWTWGERPQRKNDEAYNRE